MNSPLFLKHFDRLMDTPDAVAHLRRFILDLGVRGKLVPQVSDDPPANKLLEELTTKRMEMESAGQIRRQRTSNSIEKLEGAFEVPTTWLWVRIDQVGSVVGGGTPSASDSSNFASPGEGHPWITPADLGRNRACLVSGGSRDLSDDGLKRSSATLLPTGTVLFTSRAPIGYVAIAANPIATNQGFKSIVPYLPESNHYIALVMKAFAPSIDAAASGTTFREISGGTLSQLPFPLPPLPEQLRIVAKVDELMAICDQLELALITQTRLKSELLQSLLSTDPNKRGYSD